MRIVWLHVLASRIRGALANKRLDDEFDRELQDHLAMLVEENIGRGMPPEEATRAARIALGGLTQIRETHRGQRGLPQIEMLLQDLRYGLRTFGRNPVFTIVAVLTLALAIGVNTTLFTAFDAVALKPLPVKDAGSVVRAIRWFESGSHGAGQYLFSYPEYLFYRRQNQVFSSLIAASLPIRVTASSGEPFLTGQLVSDNYFSDLGAGAILGRTFATEEHRTPGAHPVIVLSYPFWQRRFNSDPLALSKPLQLNGVAFTIVGVAPPDFIGTGNPPQVPDFWATLMMQAQLAPGHDWLNQPDDHEMQILGRPLAGIAVKQAQAKLELVARQFAQTYLQRDKTTAVTLEPATFFGETNDIRFRMLVALLMTLAGMVLLIAGANLANMLLARGAGRGKELAVRLALGAGRTRLIRQLLTESVLLASLGGVAGLLLSVWTSRLAWLGIQQALQGMFWDGGIFTVRMAPDIRVFAYTLTISVITGVVFGLSPALRFSRPDPRMARSRMRGFLVGGQVGVSMLLLITAGLLTRALLRSQTLDTGFETRRVFAISLELGSDEAKARALERRLVERLQVSPEFTGVALAERIPMAGTWTPPVMIEGHSTVSRTLANRVSPGYFPTLGIAIERGRNFSQRDGETGASVAIVSESAARKFWPASAAVGKRLKLDLDFRGQFAEFEVVGIAKDVRTAHLSRVDPTYVYLPTSTAQLNNILVRARGDSRRAFAAARTSVEALDRDLLPSLSMVSLQDGPLRIERLMAQTYTGFAAVLACLAVTLAMVGIYGVMAYLVSQRIREIGIRVALGASRGAVLRLVVRQGMRPVFIGGASGLAGAAVVSSVLRATLAFPSAPDLLFGVSMWDPATFGGLSVFLAAVALVASYLPSRRALKVDPAVALRYE
jgi:macrolide transport system ATP-binding/permease protein